MRVVTWQSPSGQTINVCRPCERRLTEAQEWPRDTQGQEYATVSHGEHAGRCEVHPA